MKTNLFLLLIVLFFSCNNETFEAKRPQSQIKFVSYVQNLRDSVNAVEQDKVLRNAVLEKNIPAVKVYIKDSLNLIIQDWQVRLIEKNENSSSTGSTQIKLAFAFNPEDESPQAINKSIVLRAKITTTDKSVFDVLKTLKINDYIKINGQFIEKEGFIDIDSYSKYKFSKNVLDNPEFNSDIKSIEKL